jgi:cytochrome c556
MVSSFKLATDQIKSGAPDLKVIRSGAADILTFTKSQNKLFSKGTGREAGVKTRARPEIWTDPAGFAAAQKAFAVATLNFSKASQGGNIVQITATHKAVAAQCAACHVSYRAK